MVFSDCGWHDLCQVGCGAIGCEMLKNYALLGVGTNQTGQVISRNECVYMCLCGVSECVYMCVCVCVCACVRACMCVHKGGNKSVWMCMLVRNCVSEWLLTWLCVCMWVFICVWVFVGVQSYGVCVWVRERERDRCKYLHIFTKICQIEMWIQRSSYFDSGIWKNLDLVPHSGLIHSTNKQQICVFWS